MKLEVLPSSEAPWGKLHRLPGGRMRYVINSVTSMTIIGILRWFFVGLRAPRSRKRPSTWFTALPLCVCVCVWSRCVSDAIGADSRSIRLPFKCRSAQASSSSSSSSCCCCWSCWSCRLPPAPRTAPPAAAAAAAAPEGETGASAAAHREATTP